MYYSVAAVYELPQVVKRSEVLLDHFDIEPRETAGVGGIVDDCPHVAPISQLEKLDKARADKAVGSRDQNPGGVPAGAGSATLSIGIEILPFGRRICPAGPPGCATPVGAEAAVREPPELRPVTSTRTERLTSDDVTTYVRLVAPEMLEQLPPFASQRCHW